MLSGPMCGRAARGERTGMAQRTRAERVVRAPYGTAGYPVVHEADVAEVAVAAQLNRLPRRRCLHDHRAGEGLAGRAGEGNRRGGGEEIHFEELTPEQAREQWLRDGCLAEFADWRIELLAVSVDGPGSLPPTDTFQWITGRPPRTSAQCALDHASEFRPPTPMGEAVCQRVTW